MSTCCAEAKTPGKTNAAAAIAPASAARKNRPDRTVMRAPLESESSGALPATFVDHCPVARRVVRINPDRCERIGVHVEHLAIVGRAGVAWRTQIGHAVGSGLENQFLN